MSAADGDDARSAFTQAVVFQLIKYICPRADKRLEQRAVELQNAINYQPNAQPAKNEGAPGARHKAQSGIG